MRAMLSSLAMVLAMVKAPGDVVGDDPSVRSPAPQDPGQALAASAADRRAARRAFPVGGAHTYGDGFGDRPGHDGQDLLAGCGTPLRAAAPARVRLVDEDGAAGRHVVMRTPGGRDLVYMHLGDVGVHEGEEVGTGERVGTVGRTGNATTCHLHFEVWDAPGWYAGGEPRDPGSMLRSRERSPVVAAP